MAGQLSVASFAWHAHFKGRRTALERASLRAPLLVVEAVPEEACARQGIYVRVDGNRSGHKDLGSGSVAAKGTNLRWKVCQEQE